MFLVRDIRHFLSEVNIDLHPRVLDSEKLVFRQLFDTVENRNELYWDLLLWGNHDWYKHPWSAFFVYVPGTSWSTLPENDVLRDYTDRLLRSNMESGQYITLIAEFIRHIYENNYMVFLPSPNNVYAVNKEVVFNPGRSAFLYLRDLQVTDKHWSLRGDQPYPEQRKRPVRINYQGLQEAPR